MNANAEEMQSEPSESMVTSGFSEDDDNREVLNAAASKTLGR